MLWYELFRLIFYKVQVTIKRRIMYIYIYIYTHICTADLVCFECPVLEILPELRAVLECYIIRWKVT